MNKSKTLFEKMCLMNGYDDIDYLTKPKYLEAKK